MKKLMLLVLCAATALAVACTPLAPRTKPDAAKVVSGMGVEVKSPFYPDAVVTGRDWANPPYLADSGGQTDTK